MKLSMLASSRCVVSDSFCCGIALCVCAPAGATQMRVPSARVASQYRVVSPVRCIRIQPPEEKDSLYLRMDFVQKCTAETNTRRTENPCRIRALPDPCRASCRWKRAVQFRHASVKSAYGNTLRACALDRGSKRMTRESRAMVLIHTESPMHARAQLGSRCFHQEPRMFLNCGIEQFEICLTF